MKRVGLFLLCAVALCGAVALAAPLKKGRLMLATPPAQHKAMVTTGGTVTASVSFDYGHIEFRPDGSADLRIFVSINGASRTRIMNFANVTATDAGPGGLQVTLDGTSLVTNGVCQGSLFGTPACTFLGNLSTQILNAPAKITALLGAPAIQPFLTAP